MDMCDVRLKNKQIGHHFFDPDTMRFFRSRVGNTLYGDKYFISSEQFNDVSPRLYSIRLVNPDGSIDTVAEFHEYGSHAEARRVIKDLLANTATEPPIQISGRR